MHTRQDLAPKDLRQSDRRGEFPRRVAKAQWRKVGADTLVLHLLLKQYHILNGVAGRIWEMCDGDRSIQDISVALAKEFNVDADMVRDDVVGTVEGFRQLGILEAQD